MAELTKFRKRMQGVLPSEELPAFFSALEESGARPRKSLRLRRDLGSELERWSLDRMRGFGIPLADAVPWYPRGFFFELSEMQPHPSRHPVIATGLGFIQEAGAMEVVPALEIRPDDLVLDLCAAPGAKSSHIGEYLGESGWLVANEPVRERSKLLDAILSRHGIVNSTVFNLEPREIARAFPQVFDRVLVDAPCSGESLFAKRVEKRKDVSDREVERCALRQCAILRSAAEACAPGGRLVYATCAYSRDENEAVVEGFLSEMPEFVLIREQRRFPHRDRVPGGYFAVLQRSGAGDGSLGHTATSRLENLRAGVRNLGSRGLVRDGSLRWDGKPDLYSVIMARKQRETCTLSRLNRAGLEIEFEKVDWDLNAAALFLAGSRVAERNRSAVYFWEQAPIAAEVEGKWIYPRQRLR